MHAYSKYSYGFAIIWRCEHYLSDISSLSLSLSRRAIPFRGGVQYMCAIVTLYQIVLYHSMLDYIMCSSNMLGYLPYHVILEYTTSCHATSCSVIVRHTTLHCIIVYLSLLQQIIPQRLYCTLSHPFICQELVVYYMYAITNYII